MGVNSTSTFTTIKIKLFLVRYKKLETNLKYSKDLMWTFNLSLNPNGLSACGVKNMVKY